MILLFACNTKTEINNDLEIIPVDMAQDVAQNMTEVIEKVELVPLETNPDCLLNGYNKLTYCEELDMYILLDKKLVVSLFSGNGRFISNSKLKQGEGPEEYTRGIDVLYSPFSKSIEILTPYGVIYRYDTSFRFKEKISLDRNNIVFSRFMCLGTNRYLMIPVIRSNKDIALFFCDYTHKTVSDPISCEDGYIAAIAMNYDFCFFVKDRLFLSPLYLDYNFYEIGVEPQTLTPVVRLDFGDKEVQKNKMEDMFGKLSDKSEGKDDVVSNYKVQDDTKKHLLKSDYPLPLIKCLNDKYLYLHMLHNNKRSNFIYNRQTRKSFLQTSDSSFELFCWGMYDNVLVALLNPYELEKYIDRKCMTEEELRKMSEIKEDDNPIIVKYYLK